MKEYEIGRPERIAAACKVECDRQQVRPAEVKQLVEAYNHILKYNSARHLAMEHILTLGAMIEPVKARELRTTPATFANLSHAVEASLVPMALQSLLRHQASIPTDAFVKEFLLIHPFADGNGRLAFLLYNHGKFILDYPLPLPDYFGVT